MSETQRTLFNPRVSGLWIAGAFILLMIVVVVSDRSPSTPEPEALKERTDPEPHRAHLSNLPIFDAAAFKRTIINNNLFRPLGWTPPRPVEPYRLLGTKLATDANTPPQAILQSTAGQKTYIVSIGEKLDASTSLVSRQGKAVTLSTNGQKRTLRLNTAVTLNALGAARKPRRTTETPRPAPVRSKPTPALTAGTAPQTPDRPRLLSDWQTREGQPIRVGDARLKNPAKWGLRRR